MPVEMAPPTYFSNLPQIQSPAAPNFLENAQQAQQLRLGQQMAPGQQQLQQQQIQGQGLSIQEQQMQLASQRAMMQAWQTGWDPTKPGAPPPGVLPKDVLALNSSLNEMALKRAQTTEAQQNAYDSKRDMIYANYKPVIDETDPTKRAALLQDTNASMLRRYPNSIAAGDLITDPNQIDHLVPSYMTDKRISADAAMLRGQATQTQAATAQAKEGAELPGQQAISQMTARKNVAAQLAAAPDAATYDQVRDSSNMAAQFPPSRLVFDPTGKSWQPGQQTAVQRVGMTPEERTQADQAAANAGKPKTDAELAAAAVYDPAKTPQQNAEAAEQRLDASKRAARPVVNVNTAPATPPITAATPHGEDFLSTLDPTLAGVVRQYMDGRKTLPSGKAAADPYFVKLNGLVAQADPGWSEQRGQVRKAFTTGADGRNIGALNTASVHLDQFADAANAMSNGTFTPGNAAWNSIRAAFGSTAPTNFASLKTAVAGEMASALKGNATDPEIANVSKSIDAANSPAQLSGVVETNLHVLGAKLSTYQQRYQQQIPGDTAYNPILPAARGVFQKHGFDPTAAANPSGGGTAAALPQGGGKTIDAATANAFYNAAGGKDPVKARALAAQYGWKLQ